MSAPETIYVIGPNEWSDDAPSDGECVAYRRDDLPEAGWQWAVEFTPLSRTLYEPAATQAEADRRRDILALQYGVASVVRIHLPDRGRPAP